MERTVGFVEETARVRGVKDPVQMTVGISNGERVWAVRYSSAHESRTLFVSEDVEAVRRLHPDNARLQQLAEGDRIVVSEPIADLPGAWIEVPESTAVVLDGRQLRAADLRAALKIRHAPSGHVGVMGLARLGSNQRPCRRRNHSISAMH